VEDRLGTTGAGAVRDEPADPLGRLVQHVGPDQVGRPQIGGELDARELQVRRIGQRPDQRRLPQPGDPFQQHVAAGNQGREHVIHNPGVPDDDPLDLPPPGLEVRAELVGLLLHLLGCLSYAQPRGLLRPCGSASVSSATAPGRAGDGPHGILSAAGNLPTDPQTPTFVEQKNPTETRLAV
jgi:hypothetical protein